MKDYVLGIGACNVDIYGKSDIKIRQHFDHPSTIRTNAGGVTRNILENLRKLDVDCKLLTAVGDDIYGTYVLEQCKKVDIDVSGVLKVKDGQTGIFMQVQDKDNDMYLALCDMSITKYIDIKYIQKNETIIKKAKAIILDPSLQIETIEYIFNNFVDVPIFVDPISDNYALKIKPYLNNIYCIKPNRSELEVLSNMKISNKNDYVKALDELLNKGINKVYASLGSKGCVYKDKQGITIFKKLKPIKKMVNASGGGDAFFAAIIYGFMHNLNNDDTINYALAAGKMAIEVEQTINPHLSVKELEKIMKEN